MFATLFALLGAYPPCDSPNDMLKTAVPRLPPDHSEANEKTRRITLTRDIACKKAIMSPIHHLPAELLAQVFVECIPVLNPVDVHSTSSVSLVISQVSRQWRVIAHSVPALWATFAFAECPWAKQCSRSEACRLDLFIARSGEHPLSFRFSTYPQCFNVKQSIDTHPVLSRLFKLSHRWRTVGLSLPYRAYLGQHPLALPDLEYLALESPGPYSAEGSGIHPPKIFSLSPRLTRISLQKYTKPTRAFLLPWSQIRELHLRENVIYDNDYGVVLQQATNLESLLVEQNYFDQPLSTPIICASIKSLTVLTKTSSHGVKNLLASLVLPNLTSLDLRLWKPSGQEIDTAVQFLDHSGSSVIHFTCRLWNDHQLVRLLEKMPNLTHVDLRGSLIGPFLSKQLTISRHPRTQTQLEEASPLGLNVDLDPESGVENENVSLPSDTSSSRSLVPPPSYLVPRLESLRLSDDSLTPDLSGLTEAIISRVQISSDMTSVSPLTRVEVLLRKDLEITAMNPFQKLVETKWGRHVTVALGDRGAARAESS